MGVVVKCDVTEYDPIAILGDVIKRSQSVDVRTRLKKFGKTKSTVSASI